MMLLWLAHKLYDLLFANLRYMIIKLQTLSRRTPESFSRLVLVISWLPILLPILPIFIRTDQKVSFISITFHKIIFKPGK